MLGVGGRVGGVLGAMVGDAAQPGLFESGFVGLAELLAAAFVLVVAVT